MKVRVKHFATLKEDADQAPTSIQLDPRATVGDLLRALEVEQEAVGVLIVSGKQATFEQELKEDDLVTLIPHIAGG